MKYNSVPSSDQSFELSVGDECKDSSEAESAHRPFWRRYVSGSTLCHVALLVSVALNFKFYLSWHGNSHSDSLQRSTFAGLTKSVPMAWTLETGINETAQNELWDATGYDRGNIALDDEYAKSMDLPRSQRFPWDASKGIYYINAYHNLHCVKTVRTAIVEYHSNSSQSSPYLHTIHCLNVLRDEIICAADDTPRYTGFQPDRKSGLGQVRMCHDWKQLEAWADEHNSCWRHVGNTRKPDFDELDRYRFCPPGSIYEELAKSKWLHADKVLR